MYNWGEPGRAHTSGKNGKSIMFAKSMWKYGLMVRASCGHKSLRLKIG